MKIGVAMLLGGILLLAGCREEKEAAREPVEVWGGRIEGLVESYGAPRLDVRDGGLIEILKIGDGWKCYDRGRFHASCRDQEELIDCLDELRDRCRLEGFEARLVVSAPAETPFRKISEVVRTAARAGICDIEFLVDQATGVSRPSGFHLDLAWGMGCGWAPEIEPILICVDADEKVSVGTGATRDVLDVDKSDRTLTNLDQRLSAYQSAAEATSSVSVVQIYVVPSASYQRMIDVLACVEWNQIGRRHFTDLEDGFDTTCTGMRGPELRLERVAKPRAPSNLSQMRPLGLAPHENQLPKPPFDPDFD